MLPFVDCGDYQIVVLKHNKHCDLFRLNPKLNLTVKIQIKMFPVEFPCKQYLHAVVLTKTAVYRGDLTNILNILPS